MNYEKADIKTLKDLIKQTPGESREMVDILNTLSHRLRLSGADFKETSEIYNRAKEVSKKINYLDGEATALYLWAVQNLVLQKKKEGLKLLEASLEFAPHVSAKTLARIYGEYGFYMQEFGEFDKSFEYLEKSLNTAVQINDTGIQSRDYYYFARLSYFLNEIDDCLTYLRKALTFEDPKPSLNQLFDSIGYIMYVKGEYQKAIESFNRALAVMPNYDIQSLINIKTNIGLCLQKQGKSKEAEEYIKYVASLLKGIGNPMQQMMFLNDIAEFYFEQGNYEKSMEYREQISRIAAADDNNHAYFAAEIHIGECLLKLGDVFQTEQHFILLVSKLDSYNEKELPNINGLFYRSYHALSTLYGNLNMPDEENRYRKLAEHYQELTAKSELSQKTKKLTAKIKMEEFKMTALG